MRIAKFNSWKTKSMPEETPVLDFKAEFGEEEFKRISYGLIPKEMEDKWFIYLQNNILYFHRSWTGYCIFKIVFTRSGGGIVQLKRLL